MNEPKYPKSLSILLTLNLCALLTMLLLSLDEIGDGTRFVSGMTGMQSIVMALGLGLIALPKAKAKAKGKRLGMLGILGMAIAAPVIILYCGHLLVLAESGGMEGTNQRVFTLLSFYAAAIPLLILGGVVVHEGWGANPNSVRRQCFLYLCFLLGVAGVVVNDPDLVETAVLAIGFGIISQSLLLICLPIMKGCRLRLIGMGILTFIAPIPVAVVTASVAEEQFNISRSNTRELFILVFFAAAIVLSLLALFRLRHGWIGRRPSARLAGRATSSWH